MSWAWSRDEKGRFLKRHDFVMKEKECYRCKETKDLSEFLQYKSGKNKGYYNSYCRKCRRIINKGKLKEYLKLPWYKVWKRVRCRVADPRKSYFKYGIKKKITILEIKHLWFRDKAYLLKEPSIDRIDTLGDYTLENCRFIELKENRSRPKRTKILKEVSQP